MEVAIDSDILPRTSHSLFGGLGADLAGRNKAIIFRAANTIVRNDHISAIE